MSVFLALVSASILAAGAWIALQQWLLNRRQPYQKCEADYTILVRMLVEHDGLRSEYADEKGSFDNKNAIYHYFMLHYELLERVFLEWKRGHIGEQTWNLWDTWIEEFSGHNAFRKVCGDNSTKSIFNEGFRDHLKTKHSLP